MVRDNKVSTLLILNQKRVKLNQLVRNPENEYFIFTKLLNLFAEVDFTDFIADLIFMAICSKRSILVDGDKVPFITFLANISNTITQWWSGCGL